jgi:hypothetical protein
LVPFQIFLSFLLLAQKKEPKKKAAHSMHFFDNKVEKPCPKLRVGALWRTSWDRSFRASMLRLGGKGAAPRIWDRFYGPSPLFSKAGRGIFIANTANNYWETSNIPTYSSICENLRLAHRFLFF